MGKTSMKKGSVFFDYDGTLHNSMLVYEPAFRSVYADLVAQGYLKPQKLSQEDISYWLGWTVEDMWHTFAPNLPDEVWQEASMRIGDIMFERLKAGKAALFPGAKEALETLKAQHYELIFLSNCGREYRDVHLRAFGLDALFDAAYAAEDFDFIPKWQIYEQVAPRHPKPHVVVGDRFHDIEIALHAHIPSIGCAYGFAAPGELQDATCIVTSPAEIPAAVQHVLHPD